MNLWVKQSEAQRHRVISQKSTERVSKSRVSGLITPVFSLLHHAAFLICHPVHSNFNYEIPLRVSHFRDSVKLVVVVQSLSRVLLLQPHGLQPTRLLCPWDFPGKNIGVDCRFLLQEIFPTQESNLGLLHCRQILYRLSYEGKILASNTHVHLLPAEFPIKISG